MTNYELYIKEHTPTLFQLAVELESDSTICCNYCINKNENSCPKGECIDNIIKFLEEEVEEN